MDEINSPIQRLILRLIAVYRYWISPTWGYCCRYYPSCSEYALQAFSQFGVMRGGWLTLRRLFRCHPWGAACGYDPLPTSETNINQHNVKD